MKAQMLSITMVLCIIFCLISSLSHVMGQNVHTADTVITVSDSNNAGGVSNYYTTNNYYVVKPGDNLKEVAKMYQRNGWNGVLQAGDTITIVEPPRPTHQKVVVTPPPYIDDTVTPPTDTVDSATVIVPPPIQPTEPTEGSGFPWWGWVLIVLGILCLVGYFASKNEKKQKKIEEARNIDPVTAGPPQVPGGVTNDTAHTRMSELVRQRYPGSTFVIRNIRHGRLSGPGLIHYAEGDPREITLSDVPAYAGEVSIDGHVQTIYFLQGCGNDARTGRYTQGENLVFTPDAEQPVIQPPTPPVSPAPPEPPFNLSQEMVSLAKLAIENGSSVFFTIEGGKIHFDTRNSGDGRRKKPAKDEKKEAK